jgi:hypothetical protein
LVDGDVENDTWVKAVTCIGLQGRGNTSGTRVIIFQKPTSTAFRWGTQAVPIGKNDFGCRLLLHFMKRNNTRFRQRKSNYTILMLVKGRRKQHGKL